MPGNAHHPIESDRLLLEPVSLENLRLLWQLMRAPYLRDHQDIPRVPIERFADRIHKRSTILSPGAVGRFEWIIRLPPKLEPIGWVSIRFQESRPGIGELGYSILQAHRRHGFASEAVCAMLDTVFHGEGAVRADAYCVPANIGSRGVMAKAGLVERERLRNGAVVRGIPVDVLRYDLPYAAWCKSRAPFPGRTGSPSSK